MAIRRLTIDVLTPHKPSILTYAENLSGIHGIDGVRIRVVEQDDRTRTTEMIFEGEALPIDDIKNIIEDLGGSIHSIDEVCAGARIIETRMKGAGPR
jgi:hypothetical protein